jgi:hypothetical protein
VSIVTLILAIAAQVVAPVPVPTLPQAPQQSPAKSDAALAVPPEDWSSLPELKLQRRVEEAGALSSYVRDEVRAGRCAADANRLRIELAVLIGANGQLRRIRPQAIDCPTVEQYASGLMLRMARSNVAPSGQERWYRTQFVFTWQ